MTAIILKYQSQTDRRLAWTGEALDRLHRREADNKTEALENLAKATRGACLDSLNDILEFVADSPSYKDSAAYLGRIARLMVVASGELKEEVKKCLA
jgi:hypothetical protein